MRIAIGVAGIALILLVAVLLSANRRAIRPRIVVAAFALQAAIAALALYVPWGAAVLDTMAQGVIKLLGFAKEGTRVLLGGLVDPPYGNVFAIGSLPVIIFFAALISILYYLGIMQFLVRWIGGGIRVVTGISRVESLAAAANIFVGQSESPLVVRPYLATMTPAQIFTLMSVGMAGVAGTILLAYVSILGPQGEALLPYLLAASFMSAPGGILMAKIIMPDDPAEPAPEPLDGEDLQFGEERPANIIMAAAEGAQTGVKIAVAVGAMVLAFVSLVALANGLLGGIGGWFGAPTLSFQQLVGYVFAPVMWMLGVPWENAQLAGGLFGTKVVLNEFVAFIELGQTQGLSPHSLAVITFALCGFANFSSIAIQMAATGQLAPNQRPVIARFGIRALIAGSLANLMSAALANLLIPY
jgi:concentrative nucleoside transporter, CNT family